MFEVGFTELLVIFVLALIVLGPEKLPRLAAQVGRWIGRARAMAKQFRDQLEDEVNIADMNKWQQSSKPAEPPADPPPDPPATSASDSTPPPSATPETPVGDPPYDASAAQDANGSGGHHYSGPPPEPEASVYEPPAYARPSAPGVETASETPSHPVDSPPDSHSNHTTSHDTAAAPDERPARPGDVITTTHERGI